MWSNITERLRQGETLYGTMVRYIREPSITGILARAGFDFVLIDMEHSVYSFETVADHIRTARDSRIAPIVRPPAREKYFLSRLLDAGAAGLMVPMTERREHAEVIRDACRYRPVGKRGVANSLAQTDFLTLPATELVEQANRNNLIITQIESEEGVRNIDEILQVEGIDAVIIGPNDLSDSMGIVGQTGHPQVQEAIGRVVEACRRHGKFSGIHTGNLEQLRYWRERGMQLLAYQTDVAVLYSTFNRYISEMKAEA